MSGPTEADGSNGVDGGVEDAVKKMFQRAEEKVRRSARQKDPKASLVEDGAQDERLELLKRTRSGQLSNFTRRWKAFQQAVEIDDIVNFGEAYEHLTLAFDKFDEAHFRYVTLAESAESVGYAQDLTIVVGQYEDVNERLNIAKDGYDKMKSVKLMRHCNAKCNKYTNDDSISDLGSVRSYSSSRSGGSRASSTRSRREAAAAKKAALIAESRLMEQALDLEAQQRTLQIQQRKIQMQAKIAAAEAMEQYYDEVIGTTAEDKVVNPLPHPVDSLSRPPDKHLEILDGDVQVFKPLKPDVQVQFGPAEWHKPMYTDDRRVPGNSSSNSEVKPNKWCIQCNKAIDINFTYCSWCGCCQTVRTVPQDVNSPTELQAVIDRLEMPKVEIPIYDGSPIHYHEFINAFQSTVGTKAVGEALKLRQLVQYCTGKAREVIRPCLLMSPKDGYYEAIKLLETRFGEQHRVAKAWVQILVEGPVIKPHETAKLQDFADKVRGCMLTLKALGKMNEVELQDRMIQILSKLPFYVQSRWRKEAYDKRQRRGVYPTFEEFAIFLEKVAGEANDPIFGQIQLSQEKADQTQHKRRDKGVAFNIQDTSTSSQGPVQEKSWVLECKKCSGEHKLNECSEFKSLTPEKRLEFVKAKRLCYNCIQFSNHGAAKCKREGLCHKVDCKNKHSGLLHDAFEKSVPEKTESEKKEDSDKKEFTGAIAAGVGSMSKARLPIVPILIQGREGWIRTAALLDPGSTRTLCSKALMNMLDVSGETTYLDLKVVGGSSTKSAKRLQLHVKPVKGHQKLLLPEVYAIEDFPDLGVHSVDTSRWTHLQDIQFLDHGKAELLIGNNVSQAFRCLDERNGTDDEPIAVRTMFGWILHGDCGSGKNSTCYFIQAETMALERQVEQFWKLDDIPAMELPQYSQNDKAVLKLWDDSVSQVDGHYQLPIPFKKQPPQLPNNRFLAVKRLQCLQRKLERTPGLKKKYHEGIQELLDKGYAERVPDCSQDGEKWYIPHHNVVNPKKPDKFRIVFDCSAEHQRTSLNKEVFSGPDLTSKLVGVLVRFREKPVAVMGDIEGMFLQVKVPPEHRDVLRFLFWENGNPALPVVEYRMTTHLFGGVWSPSAANYALKRIPEDYGSSTVSQEDVVDVTDAVSNSFYVDDCLRSCHNSDEAQRFIQNISTILAFGGFHIKKWISNCPKVVQSVPEEDRAASVRSLDLETMPVERALGVVWHTDSDTLGVQANPKDVSLTRRGVLSMLSSVYDPLGLVSPFVLKSKLIFQQECRLNKGWDDPLEDGSVKSWQRWLRDLSTLETFTIPRCLVPTVDDNSYTLELHHFCDASEAAYGAVSYLRVIENTGSVHCSFIMSKSKLAPMKYMTIPRLELCGAVVATKLNTIIRHELCINVKRTFYWTDSLIVLQYIKNKQRRFHTFVANRVSIIHENSDQSDWYHVGTKLNPADHASRGLDASDLIENKLWLQGPDYLWQPSEHWPEQLRGAADLLEGDEEVKKSATVLVTKTEEVSKKPVDKLIEYYSCWYKLRKAVCWIRRFFFWIKNKEVNRSNKLEVSEMLSAEKVLVKYIQNQCYPSEIKSLENQGVTDRKSEIYGLDPVLDDSGLLRIRGRLRNAPIPDAAKQPMILPKVHHMTKLIVRDTHEFLSKHCGREYVLARLRERYWVPNVRSTISAVIANCYLCKRLRGKLVVQQMADLPADRVTPLKPPFFHTGVDCFGPILVKRGRSQEKRFGCIFTCMAVRAIHLEILPSMEADSFINALIRFAARRTFPGKIRSDNGTNFVGGRNQLKEEMAKWSDDGRFRNEVLKRGIDWQFNPPAASHMGGSWERMIRTVRKTLDVLLKGLVLDDERLATVFCEVEAVVNRRPLVSVPNDEKVLTPQDLLQPYSEALQLPPSFRKEDQFGRRWRHVQYLVNQFWKNWTKVYLPTLQIRKKWLEPQENLAVGDVVMVLNEALPRNQWPLATVVEVIPGSDGLVRVVKVKTRDGVYMRPVHKLCLLESAVSQI